MSDLIRIEGLLLRTIIGVNEEERRDRQDVLINITLCRGRGGAGDGVGRPPAAVIPDLAMTSDNRRYAMLYFLNALSTRRVRKKLHTVATLPQTRAVHE